MVPRFTAEAALPPARGFYMTRSRSAADGAWVTAQQDLKNQTIDGNNALGVTTVACSCPCCVTHGCGWFGTSTCMTCC